MRTRYYVAAQGLRGAISAYAKHFSFIEVDLHAPQTGERALKRWRGAVPPKFEFAVRVRLSKDDLGKKPAKNVKAIVGALATLRSRMIVVATDRTVTPGRMTRDLLARFFAAMPSDAASCVWEPSGLWETDAAVAAAKEWGVTLSVDPIKDPIPAGPTAYLRIRSLGASRRASTDSLTRVVDRVGARREAFVIFESDEALALGKELRRLVNAPKRAVGGMGRVLRPKTSLPFKVADDEQE